MTDAPGIAKVHVDSWRTTYQGILPDSLLENLSYEKRTELWQRNLSREDNYVYVAENEVGEIVGFADCGKRESNTIDHSGDLTSIYILEEYQGKGIGKQLMSKLFQKFQELEYNRVIVEVLEDNKTRYFYEHYGATLMETMTIKMAGTELDIVI